MEILTQRFRGMHYASLGEASNCAVVFLHGFPCSSAEWRSMAETIARRHRVVLFDWLGYGCSDKPRDADYSVGAQTDRLVSLLVHLRLTHITIVAHDFGGIVLMNLIHRQLQGSLPCRIMGFSLSNCSIDHRLYRPTRLQRMSLVPGLGSLLARFARPQLFKSAVVKVWGSTPPSAHYLDDLWSRYSQNSGTLLTPKHLQYIPERARYGDVWLRSLERFDGRVLLLWGMKDCVSGASVLDLAIRILQHAVVSPLSAGHFPHVECHDEFLFRLQTWLDALDVKTPA